MTHLLSCFYYIRLEANVCCVQAFTRMPPQNDEQVVFAPCLEVLVLEFFASTDSLVFFFCGLGLLVACYNRQDTPSHFVHFMIFAWLLMVESMAVVQGMVSVRTILVISTVVYFTVVVCCKRVNPNPLVVYTGGLNAMMFACMVSSQCLPKIYNHTFSTMWTTISLQNKLQFYQDTMNTAVADEVQNIYMYLLLHMKDQELVKKWILATLVCAFGFVFVFVQCFFLALYDLYLKDKIIDAKNSIIDKRNSTIDVQYSNILKNWSTIDKNNEIIQQNKSIIQDGKKMVEHKSAEIAQLLSTLANLSHRLPAQAPAALPQAI